MNHLVTSFPKSNLATGVLDVDNAIAAFEFSAVSIFLNETDFGSNPFDMSAFACLSF